MAHIAFDNVTYSYDAGNPALDGLSFAIEPGQFVCILGANGSGKSTLAKHLNALLVPDSGEVHVLGRSTSGPASASYIRSQVGMVFQNPDDQIVASIVEDDVAFGPANLGVNPKELRERVTDALTAVGLSGFERRDVSSLSGGQKQRVAIAGALAMKPRILVFDEASSMLDPQGRTELLELCRSLNAAGLTIVLITHSMEEAVRSDRVIALQNGHVVLQGPPDEALIQFDQLESLGLEAPFAATLGFALREQGINLMPTIDARNLSRQLARLMGSREEAAPAQVINEQHDGAHHTNAQSPHERGRTPAPSVEPPMLELFNVSFSYQLERTGKRGRRKGARNGNATPASESPSSSWALRNVSLSLSRGEFLGVAGHTGSGKSTLIQLMNGLLQPTNGRVVFAGQDLSDKRVAAETRRKVGVVFQYPERQLFAATVFDDVAFGPRNLGLQQDEVESRVRQALEAVRLPFAELKGRSPFELSGGQQRRVALAGVLAMQPQVLVLDEPTAGLDPCAREATLQLIQELHDAHSLTVVMVSHNMDDLARFCNRIVILNEGAMFGQGSPIEVFSDQQALKRIGLDIPLVMQCANELGISLNPGEFTIEALANRIVSELRNTDSEGDVSLLQVEP